MRKTRGLNVEIKTLGIALFSKSAARGHFLEDFAPGLFNKFKNVSRVY